MTQSNIYINEVLTLMTTKKNTEFVRWLKIQTVKAGLLQQELAFHAGLSKNTVSKYFQGAWLPSLKNYKFICEAIAAHQGKVEGLEKEQVEQLTHRLYVEGLRRT